VGTFKAVAVVRIVHIELAGVNTVFGRHFGEIRCGERRISTPFKRLIFAIRT
jgi:hypothetical protein